MTQVITQESTPLLQTPLPQVDLLAVSDSYEEHLTELGNARRLVRRNKGNILYSHTLGTWFIWADGYWRRDDQNEIMCLAQESVISMYREASYLGDAERGALVSHAKKSESKAGLMASVLLAQDDRRAIVDYRLLDADKLLVGVRNGVIDLRTGEFREGRREDYITKRCNVIYDPEATCPNWIEFQERISGMHEGLIEYKQRLLGTCLSAEFLEILFLAYGVGSNGKTTEFQTIDYIIGEYAGSANAGLLVSKKESGGPCPELVGLFGKRVVFVNETGKGDTLNEARVKYITGYDTITARDMYEKQISWLPTHKVILRTNHKPRIKDGGLGMWRRIHFIPYTATIETADANIKFREDFLLPETSGIFNWMLEGWREYVQAGNKLNPPKCVCDATAEYQKDSDVLRQWIDMVCIKDPEARATKMTHIHARYEQWYLEEQGEKGCVYTKTLSDALVKAGYEKITRGGAAYFKHLRLLDPEIGDDVTLDPAMMDRWASKFNKTEDAEGPEHRSSRDHPANPDNKNIVFEKARAAHKAKGCPEYMAELMAEQAVADAEKDAKAKFGDASPETKTGFGASGMFGHVTAQPPVNEGTVH